MMARGLLVALRKAAAFCTTWRSEMSPGLLLSPLFAGVWQGVWSIMRLFCSQWDQNG
jgi:hypothetical protein